MAGTAIYIYSAGTNIKLAKVCDRAERRTEGLRYLPGMMNWRRVKMKQSGKGKIVDEWTKHGKIVK